MQISVIIPTYNRAKMLEAAIESFMLQDYPPDQYEIIVSDNNSTDNTRDVVAQLQKKSNVALKYLAENRQGVHYARNVAAKQAAFDLLYYTDDDMVADRGLLREIIQPFTQFADNSQIRLGSVGGRILPKWQSPPPGWIVKYFNNSSLSLLDYQPRFAIGDNVPVYSCHQAIPKSIFFECGGFNPENVAGRWFGDGERGLAVKMLQKGYTFAYVPASVIYHVIPGERMTQKYINLRFANQGAADSFSEYKKHIFSVSKLKKSINKSRIMKIIYFLEFIILAFFFRALWHVKLAKVHYYKGRIEFCKNLINDGSLRKMVLKDNWLD